MFGAARFLLAFGASDLRVPTTVRASFFERFSSPFLGDPAGLACVALAVRDKGDLRSACFSGMMEKRVGIGGGQHSGKKCRVALRCAGFSEAVWKAKARPDRPGGFGVAASAARRLPCDARIRGGADKLTARASPAPFKQCRPSQSTNRASRSAPNPALLGATQAPPGLSPRAFGGTAPICGAKTNTAVPGAGCFCNERALRARTAGGTRRGRSVWRREAQG